MPKGDFIRRMATNHWKMKLFMLQHLPMAWLAGLRVIYLDHQRAEVSIPHKYLNKNPFKSMYFATQAMAAELSTGIIAMAAVKDAKVPISMLVLRMKSSFIKKATTKIVFSCEDGMAIENAISLANKTNEGQTIIAKSIGKNTAGQIVSEFEFEWTFKTKTEQNKNTA